MESYFGRYQKGAFDENNLQRFSSINDAAFFKQAFSFFLKDVITLRDIIILSGSTLAKTTTGSSCTHNLVSF